MFGIGPTEIVVIVVLFLVIFGPEKAGSIARDVGRFVSEARRPMDEFKEELGSRTIEEEPERNGSYPDKKVGDESVKKG